MTCNSQLDSILELLHLRMLEKNHKLYVLNLMSTEMKPVDKVKSGFTFDFILDGLSYHCVYDDKKIVIYNDKNENVTFFNGEVTYQKKDPKTNYNSHFVMFGKNQVSFYQRDEYDDFSMESCVKVYPEYQSFERTSSMNSDGRFIEDVTFSMIDDIPCEKHITRRYNANGELLNGSVYSIPIEGFLGDTIQHEITTSSLVKDSLKRLEYFLPNLTTFWSYKLPLLKKICSSIDSVQK